MLQNWTTLTTSGNPVFVRDGDLLTIICEEGDRGIWQAETPVQSGIQYLFTGHKTNGKIRIIFFDQGGFEVFSQLPEDGDFIAAPKSAVTARVNCVRSGSGTAVFEDVDLIVPQDLPELDEYLPVPPPDMAQKHHVTGWKWGRNIALTVHEDDLQAVSELPAADEPPTYIDENEDIIPYEVKGWQHGRRLDLEIGNMRFTDEEE